MFGTLSNDALVAEVAGDMTCPKRMDSFSRHFTSHHGGLGTVDAAMELRSIALKARRDQVAIERNHSVLRRFVLGWSPQGRPIDIHGMNAEWISKGMQKQAAGIWQKAFNEKPSDAAVGEDDDDAGPGGDGPCAQKKRKLSEWNVFCSDQKADKTPEEMPSFPWLSTQYANLSPEAFRELTERAAAANLAAAHGSAHPLGRRRQRAA
eukprot:7528034-Pyramimonas_sp.AAC.1